MEASDPKKLEELESQERERQFKKSLQRLAYEQLFSIEFWFRRHYNLPPTDPRFLSATREEMAIDFWSYTLLERYHKAVKDGAETNKLEDLLTEETFNEELEKLDAELEAEAEAKALGEGSAAPTMAEEEVLINFQADKV